MMHNGGVEHFDRIKRSIVNAAFARNVCLGTGKRIRSIFCPVPGQVNEAFGKPFHRRNSPLPGTCLCRYFRVDEGASITDPAYFNLVVTDGGKMVGCRYVTHRTCSRSHHSESGKFVCETGRLLVKDNAREKGVMIASKGSPTSQRLENGA